MARTTGWTLLLIACGSWGCSSAADDTEGCGRRCGHAGDQGISDPDTPPASEPTDFGNATEPSTPLPLPPSGMDDMVMPVAGAGAECADGVFCMPDGPDGGCGQITFDAEVETTVTRHPGNVLLVFDRSGSMSDSWNGQTRWQAAGGAIQRALEPLQADLAQIGTVFFPTLGGAGCVDPTGIACIFVPGLNCVVEANDPSHIAFVPGSQFLGTFSGSGAPAPPYAPVVGGLTPLMEGLQHAQSVLASATLEGVTAVVVITDGEPNCTWNAATANQIVTEWYNNGISTYVIGLPGAGGGAGVLNALAQAGGTDEFLTPADPAALEAQLAAIVSETVETSTGFNSCEIDLTPAADVPDELLMIVDEPGNPEKLQVPRTFGWSLNPAGNRVSITGQLCDEAMGGRFTSITFEYACPDVPPPDPLPPLQ